ncbi:MAG: hypothetical protein WAN36_04155 [Calditrichia bacterium]
MPPILNSCHKNSTGIFQKSGKLLLIMMLLFPLQQLFAQGEYLPAGLDGIGVQWGYIADQQYSGFSFSGGFLMNSRFSLGLSAGYLEYDQQDEWADFKVRQLGAKFIQPEFHLFLFKGNAQHLPFGFSADVLFGREFWKSSALSSGLLEADKRRLRLGGTFYAQMVQSRKILFQPGISLAYQSIRSVLQPAVQNEFTVNNEGLFLQFRLSTLFSGPRQSIFHIEPFVQYGEERLALGLRTGYAFPVELKLHHEQAELLKLESGDNGRMELMNILAIVENTIFISRLPGMDIRPQEEFAIVRKSEDSWRKVGTARLLRMTPDKIAFVVQLEDPGDRLNYDDKLVYVP